MRELIDVEVSLEAIPAEEYDEFIGLIETLGRKYSVYVNVGVGESYEIKPIGCDE